MRYKGQTVIVTGASQGIGRELCLAFAREGADCVVVGHSNPEMTEQVAEEVKTYGRRVLPINADLSCSAGIATMVQKTIDEFGKIDVLINNAAPSHRGYSSILEMTEAEWNRYVGVILNGTFLCSKAVGVEMIKNKAGKIINMTSVLASATIPGRVAYCACKAGVLQLTRAFAVEWGKFNINVNSLSVGLTMSGQFEVTEKEKPGLNDAMLKRYPIKRLNRLEDVSNAALFLASQEAANITGQEIIVDSGASALLSSWDGNL
ncbi:MAG TPA: SDR family oxidoreductase [Dehalococcoidales bacterium]|nr:SDR family oxidoreductase [Dehalococcoidales bacterium]